MTVWELFTMSPADLADKIPAVRRFFEQGYTVEPSLHAFNKVGLTSHYHDITLNLATGDLEIA